MNHKIRCLSFVKPGRASNYGHTLASARWTLKPLQLKCKHTLHKNRSHELGYLYSGCLISLRSCRALDTERFVCSKFLVLSANHMLWVLKRVDSFEYLQHRVWLDNMRDIVGKRAVNPAFSGPLKLYLICGFPSFK